MATVSITTTAPHGLVAGQTALINVTAGTGTAVTSASGVFVLYLRHDRLDAHLQRASEWIELEHQRHDLGGHVQREHQELQIGLR